MKDDLDARKGPGALFLIPLTFILASLIFLSPLTACPHCVAFPPGSAFTDLLITHLPNAEYWRRAVFEYGQWPLWNAQLFGGQPFAADPLAGIWYPPNLLLLILPLPLGFNVLLALHLAWGGYGLFRYLCADGLAVGPALLGGLAFAGTPKLIAHIGAGHVSLACAVAWTPWLLLAMRRVRGAGGLRAGAGAGAVLALILLADVRWAFFAALLAGAYWLAALPPFAPPRVLAGGLSAAAGFAFFALALSAVLTLPLFVFVGLSGRAGLSVEDAAIYSLPPVYLAGLVIPNLRGFHEWMTYVGVLPLLLAPLGILSRRQWFWGLAAWLAGSFALGGNFALFPLLFRLVPGLAYLRVPPRAWFVVALAAAVLAAHGLQALCDDGLPRLRRRPLTARWLPPARGLAAAVVLLTVLDLWRVDVTLIEARPRPERAAAAAWVAAQSSTGGPGEFRVYSPSYSLPLDDGLEHVDGVNPLHLAASARFIGEASGVPVRGYTVTLPPFESADLSSANADAVPDAQRLGLLNTKYIAAEFPLDAPALEWAGTFGTTRVYENRAFRPRAWMEGGGEAKVNAWSPNRIEVAAAGPGRLTLSEVMYPGWEARVDGTPVEIETAEAILRRVTLGPGPHTVVFEFRPPAVYLGLALSGLGLILLLVVWRWGPRSAG